VRALKIGQPRRTRSKLRVAARKLGVIAAEVAVALSLSLTHKAVGFDRWFLDVDFDTLNLVPTGTLPTAVQGGARPGGIRNRQQPRQPIRPSTHDERS
jgi:hypothetical protein